jgi:hypothetical protein
MFAWILALVAGVAGAVLSYPRLATAGPVTRFAAMLRGIGVGLVAALGLNVLLGAGREPQPLVALDVSRSWLRGRDSTAFRAVRDAALRAAPDSVLAFGDSVRRATDGSESTDAATRLRPIAERAIASGRPVVVYTDGEIDDPDVLSGLPSGSRVILGDSAVVRDAAISEVQAPRVVSGGDTVEARVTVVAASGGAAAGTLTLSMDGRTVASTPLDSLGAFAERTVVLRFVPSGGAGDRELRATLQSLGDGEPANDAGSAVIDVTTAAAAVLVSSSPDLDARELAALLRGTVALPTKSYLRVAPGQWREDGSLAPVSEETVKRAVLAAPLVVLHGDTALFGAPRAVTRGALALVAPPPPNSGEWFATGAPLSPMSTSLAGMAWDSLPPLEVAASMPTDVEFEVLEVRRARRLDRRVAIAGWERPRRIIVAGAAGFWRWRFRGGVGTEAYSATWGSIFDWLAGERSDVRAAVPATGAVRAGDPIVWQRGTAPDSVVDAVLVRRGGAEPDTIALRFGGTNTTTESPPLAQGVYSVTTRGGASLLVVNPSTELLPRRPTVRSGTYGTRPARGERPRAQDYSWLFGAALVALCTEWVLRRRVGLR